MKPQYCVGMNFEIHRVYSHAGYVSSTSDDTYITVDYCSVFQTVVRGGPPVGP